MAAQLRHTTLNLKCDILEQQAEAPQHYCCGVYLCAKLKFANVEKCMNL